MISVAFVFLFVLHVLNYYPRKHFLLLYLVLSSSIAVDVLKSSWTGSSTGLEADVSIGSVMGSEFLNLVNVLLPWPKLSKLIMVEHMPILQFLVSSCIG